jgi:hypothetical protein
MTHTFAEVLQVVANHGYSHSGSRLNGSVKAVRLRRGQNVEIIRLVMVILTTTTISSFHLQNKLAVFNVSVLWLKFRAAIFNAMTTLSPSLCVQGIEVISEANFEHVLSRFIFACVVIGLNVVVSSVPWHGAIVLEIMLRYPGGRPECQHEILSFVQVIHTRVLTIFGSFGCVIFTSHFFAVDGEGDVVGGPSELILVPIVRRIKVLDILPPVGEVGPNKICRDFIILMRLQL